MVSGLPAPLLEPGRVDLVLASEHRLYRAAMHAAFRARTEFQTIVEAADGDEVIDLCRRHPTAVVLLSEELPGAPFSTVCTAIKSCREDTRVIVLGRHPDAHKLQEAVEAGADGYFTADMALSDMVTAVEEVENGHAYVPPGMLSVLLRGLIERNRAARRAMELSGQLTRREREVLELLVEGCDHEAVAEILVISPQTARTHIQNVIGKLGVHSRLEAAAMATEYGLVAGQPLQGRT